MPKIVSTIGSSHSIEQVISNAREYIVIITPFLKITTPLFSRMIQADKRGVKILMIYGKNEMTNEQKEKLSKFQNLNLYYLQELHAKCYLNESFGIMSSMNLYEYSQINNWELGMSFSEDDEILKDQLLGEIELMFDSAEVKIESFKKFELVKKRYIQRLAEYLNNHFKSEKFKYEKEEDDFFDEYYEEIEANGFPNKNINIHITNEGTKIEFLLNYKEKQLEQLKSKINVKIFNDEFRVYHNRPDCLSMYNSIFHRDKWDTYSDKIKSEHISRGIERMSAYLVKLIGDGIEDTIKSN